MAKALQYRTVGADPEAVEIETPEPGPGQMRLRVIAAGGRHSDVWLMRLPADKGVACVCDGYRNH